MALIKCDECGYWCSSNDDSCPNCGYPINPPKPPKNNGKQNLYIILAIVVIVAITTIFALLYTDLAKREQQAKVQTEMLAKELREKKRADSISALRTREEAIRKAQEDSIEVALAYEEQQRVEEEERVRREGVQKTISLTRILDSRGALCGVEGNYGGESWTGMFHFSNYAYTKMITVPNGKVWIYKGYRIIEGEPTRLHLLFFSREKEIYNHVRGYDKAYPLQEGGVPVLRAGDHMRLIFDSPFVEGRHTVYFYFTEKDEDYYY